MKHSSEDTIAAIATPLGVGGIGVIRISGEDAVNILCRLFIPSNGSEPESHRMLHGWIVDSSSDARIDQVLACLMKGPKSYTGEDVVELYCHGGMALIQKVLLLALAQGARLADRGEFTKRAFLNGKMDLTQAEAVVDLVRAKTSGCAGYALRQLEGKLSRIVSEIRNGLLRMLAELEAEIDFSEDLPEVNRQGLVAGLGEQISAINRLLATAEVGRIFRSGLATVILGKPNVGKSCLLNALLGEERAIVSEMPGTTRDSIEETINIYGIQFRIIDTAGIRHPKDRAEEFGVARTLAELEASDFVLVVIDASERLDAQDLMVLEKAQGRKGVVVLNKVDLGCCIEISQVKGFLLGDWVFKVSAKYGDGIPGLIEGIYRYVVDRTGAPGDDAVLINARHKECLVRARMGLEKAAVSCSEGLSADFITIDLKDAVLALGEVTGEIVSEEVINTIFDQFCVGK